LRDNVHLTLNKQNKNSGEYHYHGDGVCGKTGRPYHEMPDIRLENTIGPLFGRKGHAMRCSECGQEIGFRGIVA
jgi:hypothetical protein